MSTPRSVEISDDDTFRRIPPCADLRFDHRTCDYWEDADRGSRNARPAWLNPVQPPTRPQRPGLEDNPFAPSTPADDDTRPFFSADIGAVMDPLGGDDLFATPAWNPFAPTTQRERPRTLGVPRKQGLLDRGRGVFGSYARVLLADDRPVAYAQFGPLSAYPRAGRLRELYPQLPRSPLPAVITCVATTPEARRQGYARHLIEEVCGDLAARGFAAVEAYPDLTRPDDETSAGRPGLWLACGFVLAIDDASYPVMRRELD
jgi:GNAT superfamily N-acetyltransferase